MDAGEIALGIVGLLATGTGGGFVYRLYKASKTESRADRAQESEEQGALRSELVGMLRDQRALADKLGADLRHAQDLRIEQSEKLAELRSQAVEHKRRIRELEEQLWQRDAKIYELSAEIRAEKTKLAELISQALDIQLADQRPLPQLPATEPPPPDED